MPHFIISLNGASCLEHRLDSKSLRQGSIFCGKRRLCPTAPNCAFSSEHTIYSYKKNGQTNAFPPKLSDLRSGLESFKSPLCYVQVLLDHLTSFHLHLEPRASPGGGHVHPSFSQIGMHL